jgi:hypothetical protein
MYVYNWAKRGTRFIAFSLWIWKIRKLAWEQKPWSFLWYSALRRWVNILVSRLFSETQASTQNSAIFYTVVFTCFSIMHEVCLWNHMTSSLFLKITSVDLYSFSARIKLCLSARPHVYLWNKLNEIWLNLALSMYTKRCSLSSILIRTSRI